jgi:hypothetical protein
MGGSFLRLAGAAYVTMRSSTPPSRYMNRLYVGFSKNVELPKGGCLFLGDEVPEVRRARVFDPTKDCFNLLKNINHKKARGIAEVLYTISPQGDNTLTVRNGKRELRNAILRAKRFDEIAGDPAIPKEAKEEVRGMMDDILVSPVLKHMLCSTGNQFSFKPNSVILARVNREEIGEFDALVVGLLLMAQYKGQVVVPDFGFYGRDAHASLIREGRLIAGLNTLQELNPKLRQSVLLIKDKVASGTTVEDAEVLASYAGLARTTNGFHDFVSDAIA